jgi:hypothetical protein
VSLATQAARISDQLGHVRRMLDEARATPGVSLVDIIIPAHWPPVLLVMLLLPPTWRTLQR